MGKGAQGSGKVSYPAYMESKHTAWLAEVDLLIQASQLANSPYYNTTAYNPDTTLGDTESVYDSFSTLLDAFDNQDDWNSMYEEARGEVDTMFSETDLQTLLAAAATNVDARVTALIRNGDNNIVGIVSSVLQNAIAEALYNPFIGQAVSQFEDDQQDNLQKTKGRFASSMFDIGAVNQSGFIFGMALLESQHTREIAKYRTSLDMANISEARTTIMQYYVNLYNTLLDKYIQANVVMHGADMVHYMENRKDRTMFVIQSVNEMSRLFMSNAGLYANRVQLKASVNQVALAAKIEQANKDLELDVFDSRWDMDVMEYGNKVMASIAGAASMVDRPTNTTQSVLSGALSGAGSLAALGPWGAIAGAVAGGVMGYFS